MNLFRFAKKALASMALVAVVAGVTTAAIAGFGPDRPTKVYNGPGTAGFDYPVFNSFTNVPGYGDERNFFTGAYPGGGALTDPLAEVKQDDELTLQILVHNNADPKYNADGSGFAKDTTVRVSLPSGLAKSHQATAYINASNTNPKQITDTLDFGSYNGGFFELDYIEGSAHVRGNYIDTAVGDAIVGSGVTIGTKSLNGVVEGCFGEEVLVTLKVKVKMPHYTLKKEVRLDSEATTAYATSKNAALTDTLVWKMTFNNIGKTKLDAVKFIDPIPAHMTVIPGSIKVYNQSNPNGYAVPDSAIQMNGRQIEMVLGDYAAGGNAFIYFKTKTDRDTNALCGSVAQKNTAFVQPEGLIAISNEANVNINTGKTCEVIVVKECTGLNVVKINRTKFDFTATARTENATIQNYVFTAKDKNGATVDTKTVTTNATSASYTFERSQVGEYKVSVVVNTDKGVASGTCEQTVTVEEEPTTPTYVCKDVKIDILSGRKVKVTVSYDGAPANRVVLRNFEYNFGDGSTPLVSNNNPVEYTYAKDGTYKVNVKVTFAVDGVNQTVSGDACAEVVTFSTVTPPTELPNTGAGSLVGIFGAITAVGMFISRRAMLRK